MMKNVSWWTLFIAILLSPVSAAEPLPTIEVFTEDLEHQEGFLDLYLDPEAAGVFLEIPKNLGSFIYVNSLASGLGSNPVGLDRGLLGRSRVVHFERVGRRVLLVEENWRFRADPQSPKELEAVRDSFARSVLWAGELSAASEDGWLIDAIPLILSDGPRTAEMLREAEQGNYQLDPSRSAPHLPAIRSFPRNTEMEALLTYRSDEPGSLVSEVAPDPRVISLRHRYSFVALPDPGYEPRPFDPRIGALSRTYFDYSVALDQPIDQRFVLRHRLARRSHGESLSEPVDPIVYYVDSATPEPVRSALMEGASWWNDAFEAAGYRNAFRVELLPEDADPLDVRFNVIQWVHRSTRGWSYGSSVIDPRTGEVLKGHVQLGSLRVRQDRMIFEGLGSGAHDSPMQCSAGLALGGTFLAQLEEGTDPVEVALARLRQLSAHEVGHALGFAHNFAASTFGRASVMDYPAPLILLREGRIDLSQAYGVGIGEWDRYTVRYSYTDFGPGEDVEEKLRSIVEEAYDRGLYFVADRDARPLGSAHPYGNLWDNGEDPVEELEHLMEVRRLALTKMGVEALRQGQPVADLEALLLPIYLLHRYQVEAAVKMVGGVLFNYNLRGDGLPYPEPIEIDDQARALEALLETLAPGQLVLPEGLRNKMLPEPDGFVGTRELFPGRTGRTFDRLGPAEVATNLVLEALLEPHRLARLHRQFSKDPEQLSLERVFETLIDATWGLEPFADPELLKAQQLVQSLLLEKWIGLVSTGTVDRMVRAQIWKSLQDLRTLLSERKANAEESAHLSWNLARLSDFLENPDFSREDQFILPTPPGSPIGGY